MSGYIRNRELGGTYFFTVNLLERGRNDLLVRNIDSLRDAVRLTRAERPFEIVAWVVLPEHMHAIWILPDGDADYSTRWAAIKARFSQSIPNTEFQNDSRRSRGERGIWQRRFYEHTIRDDRDLFNHIDYIHYNPVKNGHAERAVDWPHSSFHRFVKEGALAQDWSAPPSLEIVE
jgi:putative transposase